MLGTHQQDELALQTRTGKNFWVLDTDKSGKISNREWISCMEAEFNRLEEDGSAELGLNERGNRNS